MNIYKLTPFGIRLMQMVKQFKVNRTFKPTPFNIKFKIYLGLAFLWPKKKLDVLDPPVEVHDEYNIVLDTADKLFENRQYEDCYKYLTDCKVPKTVEIEWRVCRTLYNMSKDSKYNKQQQKKMVMEAYNIISLQLDNNYQHYAVQKWYALLLDAKSSYDGISERIKQLENVRKHMDLAVTINPNDATTLHMLGEWCYQVTELPWHQRKIAETLFASPPNSTYEDALEYFLRAETVQPRFYSLNLLRLGHCYLKLKKEDQAQYYLALAAVYPAKSNDDHRANKEAAELLKKLKK